MPPPRAQADTSTAARILDAAEELVQVRGFNGCSHTDVSAEVGITKAALHYHFAGKADLGLALITRSGDRFVEELAEIDSASVTPAARLAAYADLYGRVLRQRRMCLCGMLAAEHQTLPQPMREAVTSFFGANETWLEKVLEEAGKTGPCTFPAPRWRLPG